jgi:excisionase family DNA binding protein
LSDDGISHLVNKLSNAVRRNDGVQLTAIELSLMTALGCLEPISQADATGLRRIARERLSAKGKAPGAVLNPVDETFPRAFTVKSLAERWSCGEGEVRKMVASGELQSFRLGTLIRVTRDTVVEFERVRDRD